ncbi:MAG TPA: ABC transporter ATP-binding protein [Spirochaetia bacterium]|nr:ABC transporter ATP-binding protein [Spirochaetia bacterium]
MSGVAVDISDLSKSYGTTTALRAVSLTIPAGGMTSIVGPDGAGKTTLIKLLTGILEPDRGSVHILGFDTVREFDSLKKHIGYLSQNFTLYGDLSVDENIEFFAEIHSVRNFKARREELLGFTRLEPFRARQAERLSGGMKQKLALACTLIHSPRVIFLDEPTTGVDPVSRREFWLILADLLRRDITIVMTTPYMDEAERSGLVGLLHRGRLLHAAPPAALKALYRGTITEAVTSDARRAARIIEEALPDLEVQIFGDRVHVLAAGNGKNVTRIRKILAGHGLEVERARTVTPSLENVFISLIKQEETHA